MQDRRPHDRVPGGSGRWGEAGDRRRDSVGKLIYSKMEFTAEFGLDLFKYVCIDEK